MKKIMYFGIGMLALLISCALSFPVAGLFMSALVVWAGLYLYKQSTSSIGKLISIVLAFIGIVSALSNIPGFIGLLAIAILYYLYKNWDSKEKTPIETEKSDDPFTNFEREWAKLTK